ncbi:MAG: hypothetical protein AW10_03377 [Candidatus Accumulibacter appositus]|uniref:DUF3619 family protein n=1 Tax=Candidatus Accumulibacter appositus TaxID=1454003 RepID=A0A011PM13_9PROT|nr:DUF3619 family protein [Accumulibacter sp.]EXI77890.1 MAG: hypothetical protein AW10_03377 [Candidatus Accumulibacter appositus]HRF03712.1 DUF3619 family protein [Accumulibacter sp.]
MNELHFAFKVRQHLNRELHELAPSTHSRLQAARERALARQKVIAHQSILATAGSFVQEHSEGLRLRQVFVALAVVIGVASYAYWQADRSIAELEVIDSALLADDLPIAAFTDRGFDAWLKSSASH